MIFQLKENQNILEIDSRNILFQFIISEFSSIGKQYFRLNQRRKFRDNVFQDLFRSYIDIIVKFAKLF